MAPKKKTEKAPRPEPSSDRNTAINDAIASIKTKFGDEAITTLGMRPKT